MRPGHRAPGAFWYRRRIVAQRACIDAALFDFGGVFTDSPFSAAEALGDQLGAEPGRVMELVFGPYDRDTDHPWHRLERGELSLAAARREILALGEAHGLDTDPFRVFALMTGGTGAREIVVERVRALRRAGIRTAIVTNNVREFRDRWRELVPVDELFEVVVDSSEVGVRKPDPAIFRIALEGLGGIVPERAAFLDDHPGNVTAAEGLGIRGILVEADPSSALASLEALVRSR
jgi:putative hydrolase of the HAD superfamily